MTRREKCVKYLLDKAIEYDIKSKNIRKTDILKFSSYHKIANQLRAYAHRIKTGDVKCDN